MENKFTITQQHIIDKMKDGYSLTHSYAYKSSFSLTHPQKESIHVKEKIAEELLAMDLFEADRSVIQTTIYTLKPAE